MKEQHEPWCINKTIQLHQVLSITTRCFMKEQHEPWCINETIQLHQVLSITTRCFMKEQDEPWCINKTIQLHQVLSITTRCFMKEQHEPWCINETIQLHQVLSITTRCFMKEQDEPWCINETIHLHQVLSVTTRCFMNQQREPWCINVTIQLHQVFLSSHLLECHIIYLLFRKAFCNSRLFLCRVRHRTFSEIYIYLYLTNTPKEIFGFWILLLGREIYSLYHCFFCCVHWRHALFVVRVVLLLIQSSALCSVYARLNGVSGMCIWIFA